MRTWMLRLMLALLPFLPAGAQADKPPPLLFLAVFDRNYALPDPCLPQLLVIDLPIPAADRPIELVIGGVNATTRWRISGPGAKNVVKVIAGNEHVTLIDGVPETASLIEHANQDGSEALKPNRALPDAPAPSDDPACLPVRERLAGLKPKPLESGLLPADGTMSENISSLKGLDCAGGIACRPRTLGLLEKAERLFGRAPDLVYVTAYYERKSHDDRPSLEDRGRWLTRADLIKALGDQKIRPPPTGWITRCSLPRSSYGDPSRDPPLELPLGYEGEVRDGRDSWYAGVDWNGDEGAGCACWLVSNPNNRGTCW